MSFNILYLLFLFCKIPRPDFLRGNIIFWNKIIEGQRILELYGRQETFP